MREKMTYRGGGEGGSDVKSCMVSGGVVVVVLDVGWESGREEMGGEAGLDGGDKMDHEVLVGG